MEINTYLTFDGTAREAIMFYAKVFDTEPMAMMTFGEMPDGGPDPDLKDRLAHARIKIHGRDLMVSDTGPWSPHQGFSGFSVQVDCDTVEEAHRIFAALAEGGAQTMPIAETFWATAFGMCTDQFGVPWMVNCDTPSVA
ncbi:VOC family protein [Shimia ponticola]|uniref:VOC family protein n=1 Tax=Shimia ponticola TaxID=2582893 RepID=UPI001C9AAA7A|nr:VOC family protein [Shimia ponticola]